MFSTLRRLSTVSRKTRSKKKLLDLDKDIEVISEQESGTDTGTSGFVRYNMEIGLGCVMLCDAYNVYISLPLNYYCSKCKFRDELQYTHFLNLNNFIS